MKPITLLLLCALTIAGSCKKKHVDTTPPDPLSQLPPYSEKGAETFGCLINGEVFIAKTKHINTPTKLFHYYYDDGLYTLDISGFDDINRRFIFFYGKFSSPTLTPQVFQINAQTSINVTDTNKIIATYFSKPGSEHIHYTILPVTGELNIKYFNTQKHIIAGTFWFDAVDTLHEDTVHIRNGRFDFSYP